MSEIPPDHRGGNIADPIQAWSMSILANDETTEKERRITLIHRVLVPDEDYPKEYAVLVTDRRSIFIRQPKTRSDFWLQGEMRWGTALITDVVPKTLQDYASADLDQLSGDPLNIAVPHASVSSLAMKGDKPTFRAREFWVRWTMQRQKEVFQVYNFEMTYQKSPGQASKVQFFAVPLGAYFKPKRQTQTRETILREFAEDILEIYRGLIPVGMISATLNEPIP